MRITPSRMSRRALKRTVASGTPRSCAIWLYARRPSSWRWSTMARSRESSASAGTASAAIGERAGDELVEVRDRALAPRQEPAVGDRVRAKARLLDQHDVGVLEKRLVPHLHPLLDELLVGLGADVD